MTKNFQYVLYTENTHDTVCPPYNAVDRVHDVIARYINVL